ncbi:MAG: alpha-2-macroglobulin family protein [Muribaculaceae bacterium]
MNSDFPQRAATNALAKIDRGLNEKQSKMVLEGVFAYSESMISISNDNFKKVIAKIDSVIAVEENAAARSVLYGYEALMFDSYKDDVIDASRTVSVEELPEDYSEWSVAQCDSHIYMLIDKAFKPAGDLWKCATKTLVPDFAKDGKEYGVLIPNVYCYLTNSLSRVDKRGDIAKARYDYIVEHGDDCLKIYYSIKRGDLNGKNFAEVMTLYTAWQHSPYSGLYLEKAYSVCNTIDEKKMLYGEIVKFKARNPDYVFMGEIDRIEKLLLEKSLSISTPATQYSKGKVIFGYKATNVNEFELKVYRCNVADRYSFERMRANRSKLSKTLVATKRVSVEGELPFAADGNVAVDELPYGAYCFTIDYEGKEKDGFEIDTYFFISDLCPLVVEASDMPMTLYPLDALTGKPVDGAKSEFFRNNDIHEVVKIDCGAEGIEVKSEKSSYARLVRGKDCFGGEISLYSYRSTPPDGANYATITTDLSVYRPGETVKFVGVLYDYVYDTDLRKPLPEMKCKVMLRNANYDEIDSLSLVTDKYGRFAGSFVLPKDGLNGTYTISLNTNFWTRDRASFQVAEFKLPTFVVRFDNAPSRFAIGEAKKFTGVVETYSQLPLKNTTVKLSLSKEEWSWWRMLGNGDFVDSLSVTTDEQGRFTAVLPESWFVDDDEEDDEEEVYPWACRFYSYTLEATATSKGGETQSAKAVFTIGTRTDIKYDTANDGNNILAAPDVLLPILIHSNDESIKSCRLRFTSLGDSTVVLDNVEFVERETKIDFSRFASGEYAIDAWVEGGEPIRILSNLIVYRPDDVESPTSSLIWTPKYQLKAESQDSTSILIASRDDNRHVLIVVGDDRRTLQRSWVVLKKGMNRVAIGHAEARQSTTIKVNIYSVANFATEELSMYIAPYVAPEKMEVKIESFRDRIISGGVENWKFTFANRNGVALQSAMLLNVYNKAVDKIAPTDFSLGLNNSCGADWSPRCESYNNHVSHIGGYWSRGYYGGTTYATLPSLGNFVYHCFEFDDDIQYCASASTAGAYSKMASPMANHAVMEECDMGTSETSICAAPESAGLENVVVREEKTYNALWLPFLESGEDGTLNVQFSVPNDNSTWVLRGIAYDNRLLNSSISREFVTYKPIMVQCELPRFVRNGDEVTLGATISNASDTLQNCAAVIELFDAETGDILEQRQYSLQIAAGEQDVCSMQWNVPLDLACVGFRVKASNGEFGDGEQQLLPVLTAISPVIEAEQFYMNPGENLARFDIPKIQSDAKVSLEYCNNPMWSCVTALPSIVNTDNIISTTVMHNLYAIVMANGIAESNPLIRQAVESWSLNPQDSVLVSSLEKNASLKIHDLLKSPWLNAARRETLQMQGIKQLFDTEYCNTQLNEAITSLESFQNSDGGFVWVKGFRSSYSTTISIVQLFGELKHLGWLPDDKRVSKMINSAVKYLDKEALEILKEMRKPDYEYFSDYVYTRMYFDNLETTEATSDLIRRTVATLSKSWSGTSLYNKAYSALILNKYGYTDQAREIVESLRQFSISTPSKGVYWDNLQRGGGRFFEKIALTSLMLQAIYAVTPESPIIDGVRQWMLINKSTNNWGTSSLATDAIYAIISTGTNWLTPGSDVNITIGGKKVDFSDTDKYLGYGVVDIDIADATGSVEIERSGENPAWGALYWKYSAPMTEVKAAKCDGLSIDKKFLKIDGNKLTAAGSLRVGDKVRVLLTIKNSQDLDYVTITDERCSLVEPIDQLSGHDIIDGVWLYRETKDSQTNIFIPSLDKGTHIISYDVVVTAPGKCNMGVASVQCQYAPQYTAHSSGSLVTIK